MTHHSNIIFTILLSCTLYVGCTRGLSGTYVANGDSLGSALVSSLTFTSEGKVEVTGMGITKEGTYELEGTKVKITVSGDTTIMTLDENGCLDGGAMLGKFCKG